MAAVVGQVAGDGGCGAAAVIEMSSGAVGVETGVPARRVRLAPGPDCGTPEHDHEIGSDPVCPIRGRIAPQDARR